MLKDIKQHIALLLGSMLFFAGSIAQADPLASTDFGSLQADITGTIAVAAGIGVALMIVSVGWDVGISLVKKFAKRGAK